MNVDLDALIADARERVETLRRVFPDDGEVRDDARLIDWLADALEAAETELRQERAKVRGLGFSLEGTQAALSRAEKTIETVKRVVATSGTLWGDELRINYGALSDALTEYDKQKEGTDD